MFGASILPGYVDESLYSIPAQAALGTDQKESSAKALTGYCRAASSANTVSCVSFSCAPGMISRFPVTSISARILSILFHHPRCRGFDQ
jgi:tRNA A37 threonylcarbamoyltransferase TsaD